LSDAIGRSVIELALHGVTPSPSDLAAGSQRFRDHVRRGVPWERTIDIVRPDGQVVSIDTTCVPVIGADGNVSNVVITVTPIVESVRNALRTATYRLELAIQCARVSTWVWEDERNRMRWDDNHPAVLGTTFPDNLSLPEEVLDLVHPADRDVVRERLLSLGSGGGEDIRIRILRPDGSVRWALARHRVIEGPVMRIAGAITDLTGLLEADELLAGTVATMPDGFVALDHDGLVRFVNPAAERLLGTTETDLLGRSFWPAVTAVTPTGEWVKLRDALTEGTAVRLVDRLPGGGGWVEVRGHPTSTGISVFLRDITERRAAQADAELARARLSLLADVGQVLETAVDHLAALEQVAQLAIPLLGDTCIVDLYEEQGRRAVGVAAVDPDVEAKLRELRRRWTPDPSRRVPSQQVLRTGSTEVFETFPRSMWESLAQDDEHLDALLDVGLVSGITVPLVARGVVVGGLSIGMLDDRRHGPADISLAEDLGRRAGLAIENARQRESRAAVARSLQARLLPPLLPAVRGLDVAARYVAAGDLDVGGDFYDLFQVDDESDRWIAAIGDVSGKGPEAAAMTGLLRHTLRAVAAFDAEPAALVAALNRALLRESGVEQFCTVVVGAVTPTPLGIEIRLANGGHPAPMIVREDGSVELVEEGGLLVGAFPGVETPVETVLLGPGDSLVLYTDGVTERRLGGQFLGDDGLQVVLGLAPRHQAGALADAVASAVAGSPDDPATDDMALLVLRAR
jgi:PAS domain S-box-containing protein